MDRHDSDDDATVKVASSGKRRCTLTVKISAAGILAIILIINIIVLYVTLRPGSPTTAPFESTTITANTTIPQHAGNIVIVILHFLTLRVHICMDVNVWTRDTWIRLHFCSTFMTFQEHLNAHYCSIEC